MLIMPLSTVLQMDKHKCFWIKSSTMKTKHKWTPKNPILMNSYPVSSINAKVILEKTRFCVWDPVIASFWKLPVTISKPLKIIIIRKCFLWKSILFPVPSYYRQSNPNLLHKRVQRCNSLPLSTLQSFRILDVRNLIPNSSETLFTTNVYSFFFR